MLGDSESRLEPDGSRITTGEPGIDIVRIGRASILSWYRSFKGPEGGNPLVPCLTNQEYRLGLFLEYHPRVRYYQRADVKKTFVEAHGLNYELSVPFEIPYVFQGERHVYLPDFVGVLDDGTLFIGEAGLQAYKLRPEALAKAAAARDFALAQGGQYWIGTERAISDARMYSLELLHARRIVHGEPVDLAEALRPHLVDRTTSIGDVVDEVESFPHDLVEAVAWRMTAEACAEGRLVADLDNWAIERSTPIRVLSVAKPMLLPPELPSDLSDRHSSPTDGDEVGHAVDDLVGDTIDADSIPDAKKRAVFMRNVAICAAATAGATAQELAAAHGITTRTVRTVLSRRRRLGESGLIPNGSYSRPDRVDIAYREAIARLLRGRKPMSVVAIWQSPELGACERSIARLRGEISPRPTLNQVRRVVRQLKAGGILHERAEGRRPRRWAGGKASYVHLIPQPAMLCEVDEHYFDLLVPLGQLGVTRLYGAAMVDVKTGCVMAAVLSPSQLTEEDYMRLLKMAMEPKDALKARYGFENDWPCTAKPGTIASDNGLIFVSERARDVIARRLNIRQAAMPPEAPSAKGVVESIFMFMTRRFAHRLPGATFGNTARRGSYDSGKAARKADLTFEKVESLFYRSLVDGYLQGFDQLRQTRRVTGWLEAVERFGAPQFTGSPDELKLLLMKAANRRRKDGRYEVKHGGINFQGLWYRAGTDDLTRRLRGRFVELYYDRRDIVSLYVAIDGAIVGTVHAGALLRFGRISEWEWKALKKSLGPERMESEAAADRALMAIYEEASKPRRERQASAKRAVRARVHDAQIEEIHPADVLAERARLMLQGTDEQRYDEPVSRHGPDNVVPVRRLKVVRLPGEV